jgi:uncharacterized protein involved in type VI secretion and phage assembly
MRGEPDVEADLLEKLVDWARHRYFGKYRGTVTDNDDPAKRARLKVRVPAVLGDLEVWAMPCVPYAGDKVGFYALPEKGTGVWVEFEAGDPSYAIWAGFFWADEQLPEAATGAATKVMRTAKSTLVFDDDEPRIHAFVDDAGDVVIGDEVVLTRDEATHTVSTSGVKSEIGGQKTELTQSSFSVDDGALEVM